MRKASAVLYLIGAIIAAIGAVAMLIVSILGLCGSISFILEGYTAAQMPTVWTSLLISGILSCIGSFIGFYGYKLSTSGSPRIGFHIFALVLGVLSFDILLILAAVFGIVGASNK